jgi:hypothetical protein
MTAFPVHFLNAKTECSALIPYGRRDRKQVQFPEPIEPFHEKCSVQSSLKAEDDGSIGMFLLQLAGVVSIVVYGALFTYAANAYLISYCHPVPVLDLTISKDDRVKFFL